jgi:hypothetical protein
MLFYRIFSYLLIFLNAFLFSFIFWRTDKFIVYSVLIISALVAFFGTWLLVDRKIKSRKEVLYHALFSLLLILSSFYLFILLENIYIKLALVLACLLLYYFYLNGLFTQYFKKLLPQTENIRLFWRIAQVFLIFNAASAFLGMIFFLDASRFIYSFCFFVLVFVLGGYNNYEHWTLGIKPWLYKLIVAWVMAELFSVLTLLPLAYYLRGAIMAIFYFLINEAIAFNFSQERRPKIIVTYLVVSLVLITVILATAIWY